MNLLLFLFFNEHVLYSNQRTQTILCTIHSIKNTGLVKPKFCYVLNTLSCEKNQVFNKFQIKLSFIIYLTDKIRSSIEKHE